VIVGDGKKSTGRGSDARSREKSCHTELKGLFEIVDQFFLMGGIDVSYVRMGELSLVSLERRDIWLVGRG